jgi:hypothetical protein
MLFGDELDDAHYQLRYLDYEDAAKTHTFTFLGREFTSDMDTFERIEMSHPHEPMLMFWISDPDSGEGDEMLTAQVHVPWSKATPFAGIPYKVATHCVLCDQEMHPEEREWHRRNETRVLGQICDACDEDEEDA